MGHLFVSPGVNLTSRNAYGKLSADQAAQIAQHMDGFVHLFRLLRARGFHPLLQQQGAPLHRGNERHQAGPPHALLKPKVEPHLRPLDDLVLSLGEEVLVLLT